MSLETRALAEWYLFESESTPEAGRMAVDDYRHYLAIGMREGQSFFKALTGVDQTKLEGSVYDTYYSRCGYDVQKAIEFLVDSAKPL